MNVRIYEKNLYKVIMQVRYKPELTFYNLLYGAAKKINFPHWVTDRLNVTLRDYDEYCSVTISHNNFAYEQDSGDENLEARNINHIVGILPSELDLVESTRIGYRRRYLIPVSMSFTELNSLMNLKVYSDPLRNLAGFPKVKDMMYLVDLVDGEFDAHLAVGPVGQTEIPQRIGFNEGQHIDPNSENPLPKIYSAYPKVAIFVDIDIYQEGESPISKCKDTVLKLKDRAESWIDLLADYLFETEIKK